MAGRGVPGLHAAGPVLGPRRPSDAGRGAEPPLDPAGPGQQGAGRGHHTLRFRRPAAQSEGEARTPNIAFRHLLSRKM